MLDERKTQFIQTFNANFFHIIIAFFKNARDFTCGVQVGNSSSLITREY